MREIVIGLVSVLVLILIYYVVVYNKLQRLLNNAEEASSGIDIALNKRFDLITNLVEVVKGYSKHESEVFREIAAIRNNLVSARDIANEQMEVAVGKLSVVVESYPQLKASEQYLNLQKNMTNVEEHLQASRRLYNRSVTELNNVIRQFPTSFIAKNHAINSKDLFATSGDYSSKPELNF
ncbi:MAG: LemA family protein [Erysipelothrix sp.]|nr:LemA family protein [Erysipelothrix sp.]